MSDLSHMGVTHAASDVPGRSADQDHPAASAAEVPIFLCYRRADGMKAARRIYELIHDQAVLIGQHSAIPVRVFFDLELPAVSDWLAHHGPALERSRAMIVVITYALGANLAEGDEPDWVHRELQWWLDHRPKIEPILIDCTAQGGRFLPEFVRYKWRNVQRISLDLDALDAMPEEERNVREDSLRRQLLEGIREREGLVRYEDVEHLQQLLRRTKRATVVTSALTMLLVAASLWLGATLYKARVARDEAVSQRWTAEASQWLVLRPARALNLVAEALRLAPTKTASESRVIESTWQILARTGGIPWALGESALAAAVSPDGRWLAIGGQAGRLVVHDMKTKNATVVFDSQSAEKERPSEITWLAFTPDGRFLIVANPSTRAGKELWIVRISKQMALGEARRIDSDGARALALDSFGRWLAVGRSDGRITFFDLRNPDPFSAPVNVDAHRRRVSALAWSSDGAWFASGDDSGVMRLWSVRDTEPSLERSSVYLHPEGEVSALAFDDTSILLSGTGYEMYPDGRGLVRDESVLRIWRTDKFKGRTLPPPIVARQTGFLRISKILPEIRDNRIAIVGRRGLHPNYGMGGQGNGIERYQLDDRRVSFAETGRDPLTSIRIEAASDADAVYDAHVIPAYPWTNGRSWLISALTSGGLELRVGETATILYGHDGPVRSIADWPGGFVTTSEDGTARIWSWDGSTVAMCNALPSPDHSWTAEDLVFFGANDLLIRHGNGRVTTWKLGVEGAQRTHDVTDAGFITRRDGHATIEIDGRKWIIMCTNFRNGTCSAQAVSGSWQEPQPLTGTVADVDVEGDEYVAIGDQVRVCPLRAHLAGRQTPCTIVTHGSAEAAVLTKNRDLLFTANREVTCDGPCDAMAMNGSVSTRMTWFRRNANRWTEVRRSQMPEDVVYLDKRWVVGTQRDARSSEGYEVWRVDDVRMPGRPLISEHKSTVSLSDATVVTGRWLFLGNWKSNADFIIPDGDKVYVRDLAASNGETMRFVLPGKARGFAISNDRIFIDTDNGTNGSAWIFDTRTEKATTLSSRSHDAGFTEVVASEDGRFLAAGDAAGRVSVWNTQSADLPPIDVSDFSRNIDGLALSSDGRWLAVSAREEAPRVYSLDRDVLARTARRIAGRDLSDDERARLGMTKSQ